MADYSSTRSSLTKNVLFGELGYWAILDWRGIYYIVQMKYGDYTNRQFLQDKFSPYQHQHSDM